MENKGFSNVTIHDYPIPMSLRDNRHTITSVQVLRRWAESLVEFSLGPMTANLALVLNMSMNCVPLHAQP
ncbi:hypothetical protein V1522DRAFT_71223 [Lipomyces starkeyi]